MDTQITLFDSSRPEREELSFLEDLRPTLVKAIVSRGGAPELIAFNSTKTKDNSRDGYTSVFCGNFTVLRLRLRKGQKYASIPAIFHDMIPSSYPTKKIKSDPKYIRLLIDEDHPVESYAELFTQLTRETIDRYPKEWDCCSRFKECSDAKRCVHPDKAFSLGCGYRKILNSGKVFYGQNRNIVS